MDISAYVWNGMSNFPLCGIPYEYGSLNTETHHLWRLGIIFAAVGLLVGFNEPSFENL